MMRTRGAAASSSGLVATSHNLRPRQATGSRSQPAGGTVASTEGRITRSSAMRAPTTPTQGSRNVPVPQPTSHKRSSPSDGSEGGRRSKRSCRALNASPSFAPNNEPRGRVTRSLTMRASTTQAKASGAAQNTATSHKRASSLGDFSARRSSKRSRPVLHEPGFYAEDSDSESGDEPANPYMSPDPEVEPKSNITTTTTTPTKQRAAKKASPKKPSASSPGRTKKATAPVVADSTADENQNPAIIPNWASLPHLVLALVLRHASAPLDEPRRIKWLIDTGLLSKAFMDAAVDVLYESPPLLTRPMAHGLVSLLLKDDATTYYNYRYRIRELWLDVENVASKTYKGNHLDLTSLISHAPQLKTLRFFHPKDFAPYRNLDDSLRWQYPASLFEALNGAQTQHGTGAPIRLKDWQWNRRLMGRNLDLAKIEALHRTPPFQRLKHVSFVNYQVPSLDAKDSEDDEELEAQDKAYVQSMAGAINALPDLTHLTMESSTVANDYLFPLLPKNLKSLELINCWEVTGENLAAFLLAGGSSLERLVLHHNQSLNLSFLTILGSACPNLRVLSVDCKTYKLHEFLDDSDPTYDELLTPEQRPDWPPSLEAVQMLNMKKWSDAAADTLFQSLVDGAPSLPHLRWIELKAMLDIPIQERSRMRNRWDHAMRKVFLREKVEPQPLFSLRPPAAAHKEQEEGASSPSKSRRRSRLGLDNDELPSRRSVRLAAKWSDPSSRGASPVRELRNGLVRPSYVEPDTDEDDFEEEDDDDDDNDDEEDDDRRHSANPDADENGVGAGGGGALPASPGASSVATHDEERRPAFRHGLCERVEIQIDNQKVAERTLTMDDFLDSDQDDLSDEDWDGDDEEFDTGYAW
ncbi:hypothetical protein VTJ83DRAFT_6673 [Remersonia thermophila]|uniref:Uncharacterized protein n=1 Tax=Remersonia thermophila TaxID=72144 RepID=A0ABR4D5G3_9PEZI